MASGATPTHQMDNLPPPIDGRPGGTPPRPTNSSKLGQELLGGGHNEGPVQARRTPHTQTYDY
jgi:hypothetical protein